LHKSYSMYLLLIAAYCEYASTGLWDPCGFNTQAPHQWRFASVNGSDAGRMEMQKWIAYEGDNYRMDVRNICVNGRQRAMWGVDSTG
jgi:hypothetical protein